ncbi:MAG: flagellin [Angelakisella sp.]|nr:flagellin [Angelakisella sp.]
MGMVVRSNIMAMNANRQLGMNNTAVGKSLEKLSSGFRINRAGDDASGLAISEKMKAQIKGLETASANSQDGISLVQTAEGALTEVHSMLNRMTELATKSANGTMDDSVDRVSLQKEVDALKSEINRIAEGTNYNGINLIDGTLAKGVNLSNAVVNGASVNATSVDASTSNTSITAGAGAAGGSFALTVNYVDANGVNKTIEGITYTSVDAAAGNGTAIADALKANAEFSKLFDIADDAAGGLTITSKTTGADSPKLTTLTTTDATVGAIDADATTATGGKDAGMTVTGAFIAGDSFTLNGKTFTLYANGTANTAPKGTIGIELGANEAGTQANIQKALEDAGLKGMTVEYPTGGDLTIRAFERGTGLNLQVGDTAAEFNNVTVNVGDMSAKGLGIDSLSISNQTDAAAALDTIKSAINTVSSNRADLGAVQNRLEYTINNLDVAAENLSAANSRIRDTDMAKEMMNYTKMNVLTQAAQAMLAQANQQPQSVLQLLQ